MCYLHCLELYQLNYDGFLESSKNRLKNPSTEKDKELVFMPCTKLWRIFAKKLQLFHFLLSGFNFAPFLE